MIWGKRWDAFLSYKSDNVAVARRIADRLLASGLRIWFAEYQVLLTRREKFQDAIDRGIRASRYGIALTNDAYAGSDYCGREIVQLLEQCGPQRIVEIRIPAEPETRRKYPALQHSHSAEYREDLDEALGFIAGVTGWTIVPGLDEPAAPRQELYRGECLGLPFTLDASGWTLVDPRFQGGGPCYQRLCAGRPLLWNLQFGEEISPAVYDARRPGNRRDERALYDQMCQYAQGYFGDTRPAGVGGVHLLLMDGASHFAVSYRDGRYWKRRYSVILVDPGSYRAAEFVFTFQFEGSFAQYCRAADVMDRMVGTLRWGSAVTGAAAATQPPSPDPDRLQRVIHDQPASNQLFDQGMAQLKQGLLREGIETLQRVLSYSVMAEMHGTVLYNVGLAHERAGDADTAIQTYQAAVAADPKQFRALCNLGTLHYRRGNKRAALNCYQQALAVNPNDAVTVNNVAVCYEELGELDNAREWQARLQRLKRPQ